MKLLCINEQNQTLEPKVIFGEYYTPIKLIPGVKTQDGEHHKSYYMLEEMPKHIGYGTDLFGMIEDEDKTEIIEHKIEQYETI